MKRVLSVGQCGPDNAALRRFLAPWNVEFLTADFLADTLEQLRAQPPDLVLVNRKLDADYSDGLEIIRQLKSEPATREIPVMLVSNYPEYQQQAVNLGAEPGLGKDELARPQTRARLAPFLGELQDSR